MVAIADHSIIDVFARLAGRGQYTPNISWHFFLAWLERHAALRRPLPRTAEQVLTNFHRGRPDRIEAYLNEELLAWGRDPDVLEAAQQWESQGAP